MKKILHTVSSFLVALSMVAVPLTADAQHNGGGRQSHFSSSNNQSRGGSSSSARPAGGSNNARPSGGTVGSRPTNATNPGSGRSGGSVGTVGNNNGGQRPGGNTGNIGNNNGGQRPGGNTGNVGNNNGGQRPGGNTGNVGNNRPGNNRPGGNMGNPGRPGGNAGRPGGVARPMHHGANFVPPVPFFGRFHRPTPPLHWHPGIYGPTFGTILGVTIGTTLDLTLNALLNAGYAVSSYGDDVIYLTDVQQMNYLWPDAAMYYSGGRLYGSQFTYTTSYYDMGRYNALYNAFCRQYGNPVSYSNQGGVMTASWFGANNRYVTLEFNSSYGNCYYTTLSYGM
jgi:hypothetical protein